MFYVYISFGTVYVSQSSCDYMEFYSSHDNEDDADSTASAAQCDLDSRLDWWNMV